MTKQKSTDQLAADRLTFAGLVRCIEHDVELSPRRKRDLASAVRSFCRCLDIDLEQSPVGIAPYRDKFNRFDPAFAGISRKRWSNTRSDVTAALGRYGVRQGGRPAPSDLTPDWVRLRAAARNVDIRLVRGLSRLIHHCNARSISPDQVGDREMQAFGKFLDEETLHCKPRHAHRATCVLWNRAADKVPDWPKRKVTIPSYRNSFSLPLSAFPRTFQIELDCWLAGLAGKDLLADDAPIKPLRPETLRMKREQVRRLASALVASGYPIDQLTSLACLVDLVNFRQALNWYLKNRSAGQTTPSLFELTYTMVGLAEHWVKVAPDHLVKLKQLVQRLRCRKKGLTPTNRSILRQFDDKMNVLRLVTLPDILLKKARKQRNPKKAALRVQTALGIELLLHAPIRLRNLTTLRFDRHLDYRRAGRRGIVHLVIPEVEVKNGQPLEFQLPRSVVGLLETYRNKHLPQLAKRDNRWLFPGINGRQKHAVTLADQLIKAIARYAGLRMTVHSFRHVAAKLYLDRNPGAYALVSRLLGHKSIQTTMDFYTGLESKAAGIAYDEQILRIRGGKSKLPARDR